MQGQNCRVEAMFGQGIELTCRGLLICSGWEQTYSGMGENLHVLCHARAGARTQSLACPANALLMGAALLKYVVVSKLHCKLLDLFISGLVCVNVLSTFELDAA